ncbi:glutathione S-transferase family protein [Pseudohongiella sp.]|uniref:GST N-terminal domain-containing protein n=1 Tax=marine sediment metagenome TaxID=412755 RepID=A0A0F9YAI6_9ZZZZ|nr:glutathione S-transferase family protein [Pseudohongiella sp.]HDZ07968.1 glutathione S-transferase family protein [Pseudohongiella sp.]HEA64425.1 glutathione S-transferase family protein [Pseudohongiella sp.]
MTQAPPSTGPLILYGAPHSLYTGVVRCYLRTQGTAYIERPTSHPDFAQRITPAIGRSIIPVVELPDGSIIQDSVEIIDHFERAGVPWPAYPEGPLQRVLAIIVQYYGSQAMLRHAMHYRWSYLGEQEAFIKDAFAAGSGPDMAGKIMARMQSYLPQLGVTEASIPLIERSFESLMDILEQHLRLHPYLFGGRPSVADYGLIGPMFAHLGRDPVPADLMKRRAPRVFRWVERMTAPGLDVPEFVDYGTDYFIDDSIPETLTPLFAHIADEIFPELTDKLVFMDVHVNHLQPADGQPVCDKPHQRYLGKIDTQFRGVPVTTGIQPYLLYLLRRADAVLQSLDETERSRVIAGLQRHGLDQALPGERGYSVDRRGHIEVWEIPS